MFNFSSESNFGPDMKNALLYGLLITLGLMAWVFARFYMGGYGPEASGSPVDFLAALIPLIGLYFGIRNKRQRYLGGHISYSQAFREGMLISFFTGIFTVLFFLVFYYYHPETLEQARQLYEMQNASRNLVIAADLGLQFLGSIVGGMIFSLILAAVLKRTSPHSVA
jgi:hypothetical protein